MRSVQTSIRIRPCEVAIVTPAASFLYESATMAGVCSAKPCTELPSKYSSTPQRTNNKRERSTIEMNRPFDREAILQALELSTKRRLNPTLLLLRHVTSLTR